MDQNQKEGKIKKILGIESEIVEFEKELEASKMEINKSKHEFIEFLKTKTEDEWISEIEDNKKKSNSFWGRLFRVFRKGGF